jgi:hypothetical protein
VAHITPSLPFIIELSSPSHAAFGLLGFHQPPTASSSTPPVPPSKTALKNAARKGKQGKQRQRDQHSALLAYMAEQGIAVLNLRLINTYLLLLSSVLFVLAGSPLSLPLLSCITPPWRLLLPSASLSHYV